MSSNKRSTGKQKSGKTSTESKPPVYATINRETPVQIGYNFYQSEAIKTREYADVFVDPENISIPEPKVIGAINGYPVKALYLPETYDMKALLPDDSHVNAETMRVTRAENERVLQNFRNNKHMQLAQELNPYNPAYGNYNIAPDAATRRFPPAVVSSSLADTDSNEPLRLSRSVSRSNLPSAPPKQPYKCRICNNFAAETVSDLQNHMQTHRPNVALENPRTQSKKKK